MQTDFLGNRVLFVSAFLSDTFLIHRIRNVLTKMVLKKSLGTKAHDRGSQPRVPDLERMTK
jgi:hypothetical protein